MTRFTDDYERETWPDGVQSLIDLDCFGSPRVQWSEQGHSGRGFYVCEDESPEEGAICLSVLPLRIVDREAKSSPNKPSAFASLIPSP